MTLHSYRDGSRFLMLMIPPDMNEDSDHRYLMFSASFNKECRKLARAYLSKDHVRIRISRPGSAVRHIQQVVSDTNFC
jgi:ATP-dependent RNA helicase DDX3X